MPCSNHNKQLFIDSSYANTPADDDVDAYFDNHYDQEDHDQHDQYNIDQANHHHERHYSDPQADGGYALPHGDANNPAF